MRFQHQIQMHWLTYLLTYLLGFILMCCCTCYIVQFTVKRLKVQLAAFVFLCHYVITLGKLFTHSSWQVSCRLTTIASRRQLRSFSVAMCKVLRTRTNLGDWSFTVTGPRLGKNLLSTCVILNLFPWSFINCWRCTLLCWGPWHLVTVAFRGPYTCTYLTCTFIAMWYNLALAQMWWHSVAGKLTITVLSH